MGSPNYDVFHVFPPVGEPQKWLSSALAALTARYRGDGDRR